MANIWDLVTLICFMLMLGLDDWQANTHTETDRERLKARSDSHITEVQIFGQTFMAFLSKQENRFMYFLLISRNLWLKQSGDEIKEFFVILTLKNVIVDPLSRVPYEISVCPAKSSAFSMGVIIRSTVRKAARLAV